MKKKVPGTWGGRRPGAGRKDEIGDAKMISLRMSTDDVEAVWQFADEIGVSFSEYVRRVVHRHVTARSRSR